MYKNFMKNLPMEKFPDDVKHILQKQLVIILLIKKIIGNINLVGNNNTYVCACVLWSIFMETSLLVRLSHSTRLFILLPVCLSFLGNYYLLKKLNTFIHNTWLTSTKLVVLFQYEIMLEIGILLMILFMKAIGLFSRARFYLYIFYKYTSCFSLKNFLQNIQLSIARRLNLNRGSL